MKTTKNILTNFYSLVLYGLFCMMSLNNLYAQTPKQDFRWVQKPIFESISGDEKEGIVAKLKEPITLYGYADSTGKVVISPKYTHTCQFYENMAAVEINGKWGFIDKKGNVVILPKFDGDDVYSMHFSNGLASVKLNNKWGFIDKKGNIAIELKYDNVYSFSEELASVKLNNKWGFIDKKGNVVIELQYDDVYSFSEGLASVKLNNKWGFIDKKGKVIIDFKYDNVNSFKQGQAGVAIDNKWGTIDNEGKIIIDTKFRTYRDTDFVVSSFASLNFQEGLAAVIIDNKYGFINKKGEIVIEPKYENAVSFENGIAQVRLNDKYEYIDKNGKTVIKPQNEVKKKEVKYYNGMELIIRSNSTYMVGGNYRNLSLSMIKNSKSGRIYEYIVYYQEGLAAVTPHVGSNDYSPYYRFMDMEGTFVLADTFSNICDFSNGLAAVKFKDIGKWCFIDKTGKIVISYDILKQFNDFEDEFREGLLAVKKDKRWGFIDKTGKTIVEPKFEEIKKFSDGLCAVKFNKSWFYINNKGKIMGEITNNFYSEFYEDATIVRTNKNYIFIDKLGKQIIKDTFDVANRFSEGLAYVSKPLSFIPSSQGLILKSYKGFIDKIGKLIINTEKYATAKDFSENLAAVEQNNKWGFIDKTGKLVVEPFYEECKPFSGGLAAIKLNGKWGFINKEGKIVVQPVFKSTKPFQNGIAVVEDFVTGLWGIIEFSTIPPTISVFSPEIIDNKASVKGENLVIKGNVTDDFGVRSVTVNGKAAFLNENGEFVVTDIALMEGENKITIEAEDVNANVAKQSFSVFKTQEANTVAAKKLGIHTVQAVNYFALVIGVQDYEDKAIGNLRKPLQDADSLIKTLTTFYEFHQDNVKLLKNPRKTDIIDALDSLALVLTENDNLLIFYAGHGYKDNNLDQGYWFPADAKHPSQNKRANWLSNSTLKEYIAAIKCKHLLLVTDACFSGSIFREVKGDDNGIKAIKTSKTRGEQQVALYQLYNKKSKQAMTSGKLTVVADDSKFLKFLLQTLRENTKDYLIVSELFGSFANAVINNTKQTPELGVVHDSGDEGGEFIFLKKVK